MAGILNKPASGGAFAAPTTSTIVSQPTPQRVGYVAQPEGGSGGSFSGGSLSTVTVTQKTTEVADLTDVDTTGLADDVILIYDEASEKWKAEPHTFKTVASLEDVDDSARVDGSVLTFDATEEKYVASTTLNNQTIVGGSF